MLPVLSKAFHNKVLDEEKMFNLNTNPFEVHLVTPRFLLQCLIVVDLPNLDFPNYQQICYFYSVSIIKIFFRFNFRCCHVNGFVAHSCQTTPYQNNWDQVISYHVPSGYYLVGVISVHHNHYE